MDARRPHEVGDAVALEEIADVLGVSEVDPDGATPQVAKQGEQHLPARVVDVGEG
jgi:hypothetical protein